MKIIAMSELCRIHSDFQNLEVFAENWSKRKSFSLYKDYPRPCCALFFICTDIHATFYPKLGRPITAGTGDVVYIPQGMLYHVHVEGNTVDCIDTYTVNFRLLDEHGEALMLSDSITSLAHAQNNSFEFHASKLYKSVQQMERNFLKTKADFYSLLDSVASSTTTHSSSYYPIRRGADALLNEWNQNKKIETYAAMCDVSSAYFYQCFREWTGKSPVEYRNLIRLTNAETMLRYTEMRINEISEQIGFEDPFYFCRLFAKHFGCSPKEYRKAFRY